MNDSLTSLSLCTNHVDEEGAARLAEALRINAALQSAGGPRGAVAVDNDRDALLACLKR